MAAVEFDEEKDSRNLALRGISLAFAERVLSDPARLEWEDRRRDYGERRVNLLGRVEGSLFAVTYTPRGEFVRVISVRKANTRERRKYDQAQAEL